jgi:uncharacterized protein (DUF58 family)
MARTILSRYLDPTVLSQIAGRRIEPRGLVLGNLAGAHKSPLSGFAVEFAGHREYVVGDDPKHIDWRIYFTRGRYFVKQYAMETNLVCHFILDSSASMRYGEQSQQKMDYAARMIAALAHAVVRQSDKVSLAVFDEELRGIVPPPGSQPAAAQNPHGGVPGGIDGADEAPRDRDDLQRFLHRRRRPGDRAAANALPTP